jgi:anti-sigma B factor antagonist
VNPAAPTPPEAVRVDGEMTIFCAEALKPLMLAEPAPAALDLSEVTEIDTAGVQLLLAAQRRGTQLLQASAAVNEVLALLHLPLPSAAAVQSPAKAAP